ncbi:hypothetical protein ACTJI2_13635 [Pseudoxanthomonas sp. 22568]|uniref:hypothetical protein n=1 Tax=Pseudoxanthomonas sp. 22568 TaxID=3453945 RepID=UPI003F824FCE
MKGMKVIALAALFALAGCGAENSTAMDPDAMTVGQKLVLLNTEQPAAADSADAVAATAGVETLAKRYGVPSDLVADQLWATTKALREAGIEADALGILGFAFDAKAPDTANGEALTSLLAAYAAFRANGRTHEEAATMAQGAAAGWTQVAASR